MSKQSETTKFVLIHNITTASIAVSDNWLLNMKAPHRIRRLDMLTVSAMPKSNFNKSIIVLPP